MGVDRAIDITNEEREVVLDLLQRHLPGVEAWVYGSRAKWTSRPQSDLDLVVFATPEQSRRVGGLREAFEESTLPFRVDLFVWSEVPEVFHKQIEKEHLVLVLKGQVVSKEVESAWHSNTWGDLATLEYGRALRDYRSSEGSYRVFGTNGPIGWHTEALYEGPSVIVGRKGAYRGIHYAPDPFFVIDTAFYLRPKIQLDTRWAYYELLSQDINGLDSGSAIPSTRREAFYSLQVKVPPISEQRAIAHILGTLDDKIELNRRMNETLEAMARALFKSWFVDFDPVRAKMALKQHATNHSPLEGESAKQGRSPQVRRWGEIKRSYTQTTVGRAKDLRRSQTNAEGLLWHYLRNKQLDGYKFRRQQPIGPYIIDFACLPEKLLIELDGGQHAEHEAYDEQRDRFLQSKGYRVLRFWNNEVFENCFDVLEHIYKTLTSPDHSPLEGESAKQGRSPQESRWGEVVLHGLALNDAKPAGAPVQGNALTSNYQVAETGAPPPHQPSPDGSASATPPQGGSDWSVERARAYLDRMDPKIADHFPDSLVVSDNGETPEGWKVKPLSEIANFLNGLALQKYSVSDPANSLPVIKIAELRNGISRNSGIVSRNIPDKYVIKNGDFLFSWSGSLLAKFWTEGEGALNQHLFKVTSERYPAWFLAEWVKVHLEEFQRIAAFKATTMGHIQRSHLQTAMANCPPRDTIAKLGAMIEPLVEGTIRIGLESRTLAALRDTLLPKLTSGKIRLRDAEKAVEAIA